MHIQTPLRGKFNIYNLLAAIGVFVALGMRPETIEKSVGAVSGVPGRMEEVQSKQGYSVFIDYAHTPDALEQVLTTLKNIEGSQRIITVF